MPIKFVKFLSVLILCAMCWVNAGAAKSLHADTTQYTDAIKYDVDAMAQMLKNKDKFNGVVFKEVCKTGGGICEEDFFNHTQVQMIQAIALAQEYGRIKYNRTLTCSPQYRRGSGLKKMEDYVKCTDNTGQHYEFKFDDVKESVDSEIQKSVFIAICHLYNGKTNEYAENCALNSCDALNKSLNLFGYGATATKLPNGERVCKSNFNTRTENYKLKNTYGLNPYVFDDMQIQSVGGLKILLQHYAEHQLAKQNKTVSSFSCNNSFNTLETGDTFNPKDDILSCRINGNTMDFVFDDMQESFNYVANESLDGLRCITQAGGTYLGNQCRGITKQECLDAGKSMAGGTDWDDETGLCTLNSAKTAETVERWTNVGIGAAVIAVTIATGGTATVILVAAGTSMGIAGSEVLVTTQKRKDSDAGDFVDMAKKCNDKTCAGSILTHYYTLVYDNKDGFNNAVIADLQEYENKMLNLVQDDIQAGYACYYQSLATDEQKKRAKNIQISDIAGNAIIVIGGVVSVLGGKYHSGAQTVVSGQKLLGIMKQLKNAKTLRPATTSVQKLLPKLAKSVDRVGDVWDLNAATNSAGTLTVDTNIDCQTICNMAGICGNI